MMYEHLIGTIIDIKKESYCEFPKSLDGQIYISGNEKEGWHTRSNIASEEMHLRLQESINAEAKDYLLSTDWYLIRESETGVLMPENIKLLRQQARERIK